MGMHALCARMKYSRVALLCSGGGSKRALVADRLAATGRDWPVTRQQTEEFEVYDRIG